jgi:hypothetical protein
MLGKSRGRIFLIKRSPSAEKIMKETINMSAPVGSVTQTQAPAQVTDVRPKTPESRPKTVPSDTVQLSSAAQAALREALETPAQTAKEAGTGDLQAKRLLAKEEAAKEAAAKEESASTKHVVA